MSQRQLPVMASSDLAVDRSIGDALLHLMGSHHMGSRRWVWEQYVVMSW